MEFDFLKERIKRIEWAVRRVAPAFEVDAWSLSPQQEGYYPLYSGISASGDKVYWKINEETFQVILLQVGDPNACYQLRYEIDTHTELGSGSWECFPYLRDSRHNSLMARGIYRLGFTNERIFARLPSLSAHEKLELRLSLPHEFWPQKWLDERQEE